MSPRPSAVLLVVVVLAAAVAADPVAASAEPVSSGEWTPANATDPTRGADSADRGRILGAYPNPHASGDPGEFVVVRLPVAGEWSLSDGERTVDLPNVVGTIAVSPEPGEAAAFTGRPVYPVEELRLADGGETLELREGNRIVDSVTFGRAPEGARWLRDGGEIRRGPDADGGWRVDGFEPRETVAWGGVAGTAFVLPDSPDVPVEPIRNADRRVDLAAYTFTSRRVAAALLAAHERGVEVRVLVEGGPVGGASERQAAILDRLAAAGIDVRALAGERARYVNHHPKYVVADDTAVVMTENWKPSGVGGESNRGWGVRVDDPRVAGELAAVFDHDAGWKDGVAWETYRERAAFHGSEPADGSYPARFDPERFEGAEVELLTAPDGAGASVERRIDAADDRVAAVVPRTGGTDYRLVAAAVRAAERGVTVRLLLSGKWYDRERNERLAAALAERAERADLDLAVRIVEPRGRFGKLHAKGVVVDDTAIVGSLNWNDRAESRNREVLVAVEHPDVAAFYWRTLAADWNGGAWQLPLGSAVVLASALAVAAAIARAEVEFV